MKKILCILFSLSVLCSGCSDYKKSSAVTAVTSGLSFTAEISHRDTLFDYFVKIDKNGNTYMESLSKEDSAINYVFKGTKVTYKYNSLEYSSDISSLPKGSVIDFIPTVFKQLEERANNVHYKNEQYYVTDSTQKYDFIFFLGESGLPLKITDDRNGISVIIKNPALIS